MIDLDFAVRGMRVERHRVSPLLFSGTVFSSVADGGLQMERIAWNKEARYRLPVATWRDMMAHYYPDGRFLCLGREVFEQLQRFKRDGGHPTCDRALAALLQLSPVLP